MAEKDAETPRRVLPPELILNIMSSSDLLTPERMEIAKQISDRLARDPELLASIERTMQAHGVVLNRLGRQPEELASFGWGEAIPPQITPRQAAAAAAAGAAAMLVPVPV